MSRVTGLGGAFVFTHRPAELAAWYGQHLGLRFEGSPEHGTFYQTFRGLDPERPEREIDTTFSILAAREPFTRPVPAEEPKTMYGDQPYMVNFRVADLDTLVRRLAASGIRVLHRSHEPYGRFAWIRDPDGNRIELYQPVPMVGGPDAES